MHKATNEVTNEAGQSALHAVADREDDLTQKKVSAPEGESESEHELESKPDPESKVSSDA